MKRKILLFFALLSFIFLIEPANAIINISGCGVLNVPGETYYLTTNIYNASGDCIVIDVSNITLDCQNHLIDGVGSYNGIKSSGKTDIKIKNCKIKEFESGVRIEGGTHYLENLELISNRNGLYLISIYNSVIKNIKIKGIIIRPAITYGVQSLNSWNNRYENIEAENSSYCIYLYESRADAKNISVKNCISGIWSRDATIEDVYSYNNTNGIEIYNGTLNRVVSFLNDKGIVLGGVANITNVTSRYDNIVLYVNEGKFSKVSNFDIYDCETGLMIASADMYVRNNTFENFKINTCKTGLCVGCLYRGGEYNNFVNFEIVNSMEGIRLSDRTLNSVIRDSKIINSGSYGLYFDCYGYMPSVQNNLIYNNFFNNTINFGFRPTCLNNSMNITKTFRKNIMGGNWTGGNYWGSPLGNGYSDTCEDSNKDEFCDYPYVLIEQIVVDYLPYSKEAIAKPPPPTPPPTPPKPTEACAVCDISQLNPKEFIQYFWIGACLFLNVIMCNPILLILFFMFLILIHFFKTGIKK